MFLIKMHLILAFTFVIPLILIKNFSIILIKWNIKLFLFKLNYFIYYLALRFINIIYYKIIHMQQAKI